MAHSQPDFDLVLFGATGDLAQRKLLPCLYQAHAAGLLNPAGRILGVSRDNLTRDDFLQQVEQQAKKLLSQTPDDAQWASFLERLDYVPVDITQPANFVKLRDKIRLRENKGSVVIYLSTAPQFFASACENLAAVGLNTPDVRIVLEKPLGHDLDSCHAINQAVGQFFQEEQIYRIDHYLGKESLQNLMPLRFGNVFFEPVWNKEYIQSVQITVAEQLGVENRGDFYDTAGALRDMVQNHIMQMLCFVAMEQPKSLGADDVRDEKLKVVRALKIMPVEQVQQNVVRARYAANGEVKGYLQENKIPAESRTETYVAIKAEIENERWQGVPFYLRTGKKLPERRADIVLNFKENKGLFGNTLNRLHISLQPDESIKLRILVKQAGSGSTAIPAEMALDLSKASAGRRADAYEILLREVIHGRLALFNRRDELEAAWQWVMPILNAWQQEAAPLYEYPAGNWEVAAATELLAKQGDKWLEEQN